MNLKNFYVVLLIKTKKNIDYSNLRAKSINNNLNNNCNYINIMHKIKY